MGTLLGVAVGILIAAIIALLLVIVFSKKNHQAQSTHVALGGEAVSFFSGLKQVHIRHDEMKKIFHSMQKHIVGMDDFLV